MNINDISKDKEQKVKDSYPEINIQANQAHQQYPIHKNNNNNNNNNIINNNNNNINNNNNNINIEMKEVDNNNEDFQLFPNNFQMHSDLQLGESQLSSNSKDNK